MSDTEKDAAFYDREIITLLATDMVGDSQKAEILHNQKTYFPGTAIPEFYAGRQIVVGPSVKIFGRYWQVANATSAQWNIALPAEDGERYIEALERALTALDMSLGDKNFDVLPGHYRLSETLGRNNWARMGCQDWQLAICEVDVLRLMELVTERLAGQDVTSEERVPAALRARSGSRGAAKTTGSPG